MTGREMAPTFPETILTVGAPTLRPLAQSDVDDVAAVRALSQWAILEHGFERVELFAATANTGSQRAAEKAGFVREGVAGAHRSRRHRLQAVAVGWIR